MKKPTMIGLAVALLVAACGDAAGGSAGAGADDLVVDSNVRSHPEPLTADEAEALEPVAPESDTVHPTSTSAPVDTGTEPAEEPVGPPEISHPSPHADIALADLAHRLAVDAAAIVVVSSEEVTWSDGSLGCPEPGMRYTQALVNGTRVILDYEGVSYHYHSGPRREPFLCRNPVDPAAGGYGDV